MRNLAAKVPEDIRPEKKARIQAVTRAPSRAIAVERMRSTLAEGVVADYGKELPSAVACFGAPEMPSLHAG